MNYTKNKKLRALYKHIPCIICGKVPSDPSHIKTYGSCGIDAQWNFTALCRAHHFELGWRGHLTFIEMYPKYWKELHSKGWEINNGKLWHYNLVNGLGQ